MTRMLVMKKGAEVRLQKETRDEEGTAAMPRFEGPRRVGTPG